MKLRIIKINYSNRSYYRIEAWIRNNEESIEKNWWWIGDELFSKERIALKYIKKIEEFSKKHSRIEIFASEHDHSLIIQKGKVKFRREIVRVSDDAI